MNILVITQLYPQPDDYGDNKPTKTVEYFAREWVAEGHNVIVAHCSSKFPVLFYLIPSKIKNKLADATSNIFPPLSSRKKIIREEYGIKIYRFPMLKTLPGKGYSAKTMQKQSDEICNVLDQQSFIPDLVIGHFANPSTELVAIISKHYKAKSSIVFHGDCNERTLEKYRLKEQVDKIGAIGTRSVVESKQVKQLLKLDIDPFVCCSGVPNSAIKDVAESCSKHDISNGIKYIYVGSFIKRKNVSSVIKAFDKVATDRDQLLIVGGGPEEQELKGLADNCIHTNQIIFTGKVTREKVLQYMKQAHVFTLISTGEVYGMVYIEAMLQGCITIASTNGGFDGIIVDGKNGFLCAPGDENMLAEIYKRIAMMDEESLNQLGNNAIQTAIHFSEKEVADRYLKDVMKRNEERL